MICSFQQLQSNYFLVLSSVSFSVLCPYSSVNFSCAHPPPPLRATAGHLPAVSVRLGMGHLQILRYPGTGHLPTLGLFPSFWHARGFLSEYNYTEDFAGKNKHISSSIKDRKKLKRVIKACSRFYACISCCLLSQDYEAKAGAIDVIQRSSLNWIKFLLISFEEYPCIFYLT